MNTSYLRYGYGEKTGKPPQVVVWPDDHRVQVALDIALEKKWPFVAHIEFAAIGADRALFMYKFEELLRKHLDHPTVLMHMGELNAKEVRRLIAPKPRGYPVFVFLIR